MRKGRRTEKVLRKKKKKIGKLRRVKKSFKWVTSLKLENVEERWNVMLKKKLKKKNKLG